MDVFLHMLSLFLLSSECSFNISLLFHSTVNVVYHIVSLLSFNKQGTWCSMCLSLLVTANSKKMMMLFWCLILGFVSLSAYKAKIV